MWIPYSEMTQRNLSIFDGLIFRISGLPISILNFEKLEYNEMRHCLDLLSQLLSKQITQNVELCAQLFEDISRPLADDERKQLINFRRDIHNYRKIEESRLEAVINILSGTNSSVKLSDYFRNNQQILEVKAKSAKLHNVLHQIDIDALNSVLQNENFLKALLLSSNDLYESVKSGIDVYVTKESIILGLLKYSTRAVTKTTPFSTFTQLNYGKIKDEVTGVNFVKKSKKTICHVKYNNYIFFSILNYVLSSDTICGKFIITLNSTIKKTNNSYIFFANINNSEAFQELERNDFVDFIVDLLTEGTLLFDGLIEKIIPEIDGQFTETDIRKYIFELIRTGFIEFQVDLMGLDGNWVESLCSFFRRIDDGNNYSSIVGYLENLIHLKGRYIQAPSRDCSNLLAEMRSTFLALFTYLEEVRFSGLGDNRFIQVNQHTPLLKGIGNVPDSSLTNVIYEDSSCDMSISVSKNDIHYFVSAIDELLSTFEFLCIYESERKLYSDYFFHRYEKKAVIPLLTFYEDLYKDDDFIKNSNESFKKAGYEDNYRQILEFISETAVDNIAQSAQKINIKQDWLSHFRIRFKDKIRISNNSRCAYVQLLKSENSTGVSCVLSGGVLPGKGKMFSRFMFLFDESFTDDLRIWNLEDKNENEIYVENGDASFFNANLHPNLLPFEIKMPGGTNKPNIEYLNVSDLFISLDPTSQELCLHNENYSRVYVFDLCFQNPYHRSKLHRLLSSFGSNTGYPYYTISSLFNKMYSEELKYKTFSVIVFPRISIGDRLIIQRKQWNITINFLNFIKGNKQLNSVDFYFFIQELRKSLLIPDEIFMKVSHNEAVEGQTVNRDDYKPQYINFLSPLSIKLFLKTVNKIKDGSIVLEEMLPNSSQLLDIDNERFVTETLVQWQKI